MVATIERSAGLVSVPFLDGAVVFDAVCETTHVVGPVAAWLLGSDEPATIDDLVEILVSETDINAATATESLTRAITTLANRGLIGRTEQPGPVECVRRLIDEPAPGWTVGETHSVLDATFAFCGPDHGLLAAVDERWGSPVLDANPTMYFGLEPTGDGGIDVIDDARWHFDQVDRLLWQLPTIVNLTAARTETMAVLHAGAVRTPTGEVILITGPIDAGKSTLIAALIRAGSDYLGDESIGIDPSTIHAWAYPKPLTLDATSQRLTGLDPVGQRLTPDEHRRAQEIRSDAKSLIGSSGSVDLIIATSYQPQANQEWRALDPRDAIEVLLKNMLNLRRSGPAGLTALSRLATETPVLRVIHDDAVALAERIVTGGAECAVPKIT